MRDGTADKQYQMLNLYLDGELDESQLSQFAEDLRSDEALRASLEELRSLRQGVRDWSRSLATGQDGLPRKVDCWAAIERGIRRSQQAQETRPRIGEFLRDALVRVFASPVISPAVVAAGLIMLLSVQGGQESRPGEEMTSAAGFPRVGAEAIARSSAQVYVQPLIMPEPTYVSYRKELARRGRPDVQPVPLTNILDREFVRGGLRSHGADIDWIRSNSDFEVFPVEDREAPPVIWVARNVSDAGAE